MMLICLDSTINILTICFNLFSICSKMDDDQLNMVVFHTKLKRVNMHVMLCTFKMHVSVKIFAKKEKYEKAFTKNFAHYFIHFSKENYIL